MGRTKKYSEDMLSRFPAGTFARIETALAKNEDRTEFIRVAVEHELKRRADERKLQRQLRRAGKERDNENA